MIIRPLIKLLLICVLFASSYLGWHYWQYIQFLDTPITTEKNGFIYNVTAGSSLNKIIFDLKNKGVISNSQYLLWYVRLTGKSHKVYIGEFKIPSGITPKELISILLSNKIILYSFTIIEGWSFEQLITVLNKNNNIKHTIKGLSNSDIMDKLNLSDSHYEGRFLPDTYLFPRGFTDIEFLKRAYNSMNVFLEKEWQDRSVGSEFSSSYQALILASIVEKETADVAERSKIAGVFIRRLQKKMRLQSDPTIIYGMGKKYQGNIRRADLKRTTAYNTYRIHGLPPTPIAMPGRDAIHSSLHPDDSNNLYFVSKGDGSHFFSSNLRDHNNAVIKYQLKGKKQNFSSYKHNK